MSAQRRKGTAFERLIADYLATALDDDRIDRMPLRGSRDRGDLTGLRTPLGERIVAELKNQARMDLAGWVGQAEVERGNADAAVGLVVHKKRGTTDPAQQYVTMTLADLARLLGGDA